MSPDTEKQRGQAVGPLIDSATLARHLDHPDWRVVDCRFDLADVERGEHDYRTQHIPGACYAHLDRNLSGPITPTTGRHPLPDPARFRDWLQRHGIRATTQVVAYDDSGGTMAVRLWWLLHWLGHTQVAVLDGGLPAWQEDGFPLTSEPPPPTARSKFSGLSDPTRVVETSTLLAQLGQPEALLLLDARTAERFRGESEPIDPVAGHIPGAVNLPLQDNLGADGRFKPADALRRQYAAVLGDMPPQRVAVMCGSGVTACHNLLAMAIAGRHGGRLYAGSWSEWIRDPARPVATRGDAIG